MRIISFDPEAFDQYSNWAKDDKKLFERIRRLILECAKKPFLGIGKPEPLRGSLSGYWHDALLTSIASSIKLLIPTSPSSAASIIIPNDRKTQRQYRPRRHHP